MPLLLGIDIGTSGIKLGLVRDDGRLMATATSPYEVSRPKPSWAEMDAEVWVAGIANAIPKACEEAEVQPDEIDAIGFSAMYPVLVPLDSSHQPIHPGILYCDQRSIAQAEALAEKLPEGQFLRITGNVITPGTCSLTSLVWLKEERPDVFSQTSLFAHAAGAVAGQFTGEVVTDWATASLSGLFETCGGYRWSEEICEAVGVPRAKLPRLVSPAERVGELRPDPARALGLRPGIPVAAGAGDTACSTLGLGIVDAGQAGITCVTTDNLTACSDRPTFDRSFANCCHVMRDRWLFIATMSNTGGTLEWFRAQFASAIAGVDIDDYESLFAAAGEVEPGAGGVICLPYLQGERRPIWDPKARALFFGMNGRTTSADLLRSVLEGVAFALRQNLDALESTGFAADEILLTGGTTRSELWSQIRADVLNRPLHRVTDAETTLVGAALLGGVAAGVWETVEDAAEVARRAMSYETVEPSPDDSASYERFYRVYERLYPALREAFGARHEAMAGAWPA